MQNPYNHGGKSYEFERCLRINITSVAPKCALLAITRYGADKKEEKSYHEREKAHNPPWLGIPSISMTSNRLCSTSPTPETVPNRCTHRNRNHDPPLPARGMIRAEPTFRGDNGAQAYVICHEQQHDEKGVEHL